MKLIVDTLAAEYREDGKGPVVLLLHGWGADLQNFDQLSSALKKNYRVVRLDLPGFGGSETPISGWSVGDYVDFVSNFLHKLEIEKLHGLIGHSFGGRIAVKGVGTGLLNPEKLILLASHGVREPWSMKRLMYRAVAKVGKQVFSLPILSIFAEPLRKYLYQTAGSTDYLAAGRLRDTFLQVVNEDLSRFAKQISVPTLLIYGSRDRTTPPAIGEKFRSLIPESRLEILPDAGHYVHNDKPLDIVKLVREFL